MSLGRWSIGECCGVCDEGEACTTVICITLDSSCSWSVGGVDGGVPVEIRDDETGDVATTGLILDRTNPYCFEVPGRRSYTLTASQTGCTSVVWPNVAVECEPVYLTGFLNCPSIRRHCFTIFKSQPCVPPGFFMEILPVGGGPGPSGYTDAASGLICFNTTGLGSTIPYRVTRAGCLTINGSLVNQGNGTGCGSGNFNLSVSTICAVDETRPTTIVVTGCYGLPVAGATVTITRPTGGPASGTTDADGKFTFMKTASGTYTIAVAAISIYAAHSSSRVINRCATVDVPITLTVASGHDCSEIDPPGFSARAASATVEYPSLGLQALTFGKAIVSHVAGGLAVVPDEEQARRMAICQGCPKFVAAETRCVLCGCGLDLKTRWKSESCPIGKW